MSSRFRAFVHFCFFVVGALASADQYSFTPQEGMLVLRNGRVVQGKIHCQGDLFVVSFGSDSEIRLPKTAVEFHCRTLDEAYARKRLSLEPEQTDQQLDLVQWCLANGLLTYAANELSAAEAMAPNNPRILGLRRRLAHATEHKHSEMPTQSNRGASLEQLEQMMRELPAAAVEQFTTSIQPILVNRCANGGCHGPDSVSKFQLLRPVAGRMMARRFTQRNLFATLQWVNLDDPPNSPLLKWPTRPHGNTERALFGKRDEQQFEELANWVQNIAARKATPTPEKVSRANTNLLQVPGIVRPQMLRTVPPSNVPQSAVAPDLIFAAGSNASGSERAPSVSTSEPAYVPSDPFDPEVFNRRYQLSTSPLGRPQSHDPDGGTSKERPSGSNWPPLTASKK